jgi:ribokinase
MILVFGSLNADLVFPVETLPKPGETVLGTHYLTVPGGKGANQAVAAGRFGARTMMAGMVGDDAFGAAAIAELEASNVDSSLIGRGETPTGCAAICVDAAGENQITVASGANLDAHAGQVPDDHLGPDTTVLLQMEISLQENWRLAERSKARGAWVILNNAPAAAIPDNAWPNLDMVVCNEPEIIAAAEHFGFIGRDPVAAAESVNRQTGTSLIITLGGDGAVALADGERWRVAALPIAPVDTTAAGDSFVGAFAAGLDEGLNLPTALHRASIAGALTCLAAGAMPSIAYRADIDARIADLALPVGM